MRRLFILFGTATAAAVIWAPSAAIAHGSPEAAAPSKAATSPAPQAATPPAGQPPVQPSSGGSSTASDVLTVVGFTIVAGAGFVLVLRAGLGSAGAEDDD